MLIVVRRWRRCLLVGGLCSPLQWAGEEGGAQRDSELEHDQWRDTAGRQLSTYKAGTSITVLSHCCL